MTSSPSRSPHRPRRGSSGRRRKPRAFTAEQIEQRRRSVPAITYPSALPVSQRRDDIMAAIRDHQVVVISGATGSGKTTQLPKMCLELGRGAAGLIGHTQPRRLAARSVAERIAAELGQRLGHTVGYQVRFTDVVGTDTMVKLMTDGILLAEIAADPDLTRYDTIIVDEAHERSLNIDFILGYLAALLPRRRDLKVVITSATIDAERFAEHFSRALGGASVPVIEVSGRTYPVDIVYRPLRDDEGNDIDMVDGICDAVDELCDLGDGDILVFLPGERDIRDTDAALRDHLGPRYIAAGARSRHPNAIEVIPLYARLSPAEQHRVFEAHHTRRVVLATNVAETSLTVPGIHYVVDPGLARISRFSHRTKVQRLPIEPISQASANQRSGRCGRVAEGVAIRLYSEEDFASRPEFTDPEILRTSLAAVILQMASLGLTPIEGFPFLDPPDPRQVRDGVALLRELGALRESGELRLTRIGHNLARLPIDPRLGRMLIEADRRGCASEVLVIVAALAMQDVRLRPAEAPGTADAAHARFADPSSDFLAYLNLWRYLRTLSREMSGSALRRTCQREYLHYLRTREWQDMVTQLRQMARDIGISIHPLSRPTERAIDAQRGLGESATDAIAAACVALTTEETDADSLHRSLLFGLLSNLGRWDASAKDYEGARGTHFRVWPGSGLAKRHHEWVMAAELVETSRLFARTVAAIDPAWIDEAGSCLIKRSYSGIYWSSRAGAAMVRERSTLYGLTISADRPVLLGRLGEKRLPGEKLADTSGVGALREALGETSNAEEAPTARELAREMFIRHALVEGDWHGRHRFMERNRRALEQAREVERRTRRAGIVAGDDALARFFDRRVGPEVVSQGHFARWWKTAQREDPRLLDFPPSLLLPETPPASDEPLTYSSGSSGTSIAERLDGAVSPGDLVASAKQREASGFPDRWRGRGVSFPLSYEFDPSSDRDGVSVQVPLEVVSGLEPDAFSWLVPGMWEDLVAGLIKAMPKSVRRQLVPAPDVAAQVTAWIREHLDDPHAPMRREGPGVAEKKRQALDASMARLAKWAGVEAPSVSATEEQPPAEAEPPREVAGWDRRYTSPDASLRDMVTRGLDATRGVEIDEGAWEYARTRLPAHLTMTVVVTDANGRAIAHGKDIAKLAHRLRDRERQAVREAIRDARAHSARPGARTRAAAPTVREVSGLTSFPTEPSPLPEDIRVAGPAGTSRLAHPALVVADMPADVLDPAWAEAPGWQGPWRADLCICDAAPLARRDHADGVAALVLAQTALPATRVKTRWRGADAATLAASPYATTEALIDDIQWCAGRDLVQQWALEHDTNVWSVRDEQACESVVAWVRERLEDRVHEVVGHVVAALRACHDYERASAEVPRLRLLDVLADETRHVQALISPGFISRWGAAGLPALERWLRASAERIRRAADNPGRDKGLAWQAREAAEVTAAALDRARSRPWESSLAEAAWELTLAQEELRVSLFAQHVGTARKISLKRLTRLAETL
ncbi:ATP-dependent RNA helicase HrpA [Nanchangia anserum]|nr:ATP-dependent RNA helicase HrpA [Nanchangia anserum]